MTAFHQAVFKILNMKDKISGLHHITAIAGNAKRNVDFYTKVLGLRLVKKTVNFDDPNTYHLYYGNRTGTPGTILTFFPWEGITIGRKGARQVTEIAYLVPEGSLDFWLKRFDQNNVIYNGVSEKFGENYVTFLDPDGLKQELVVSTKSQGATPWETEDITSEHATRGFYNITISNNKIQPTADILTNVLGYRFAEQHVNRFRFVTDHADNAAIVDLVEVPGEKPGHIAGGSVHHVAFRVDDEDTLMKYREKIDSLGLNITDKIDRNYFYSLYFREPGGVLFEIATENPGFANDESVDELGTHLMLPEQYEGYRAQIEQKLPVLT